VYFRELSYGSFVYLLLYDDDMLITTRDMAQIDHLKEQLKGELEKKYLGAT